MLSTLKSYAMKPSTYVILAIGAIIAFAFGRFLGPLKSVAQKLPGAQS